MNPQPSTRDLQSTVHLHIDRLVLDGVPLASAEVPRLQAAMEQELGRLLASAPAEGWSEGDIPRLSAEAVQLAPGGSAQAHGRAIAQSLFSSLVAKPGRSIPQERATHGDFFQQDH